MTDPLKEELRALARDLQESGVPLVVGGGYGLLLRAELLRESGARTLMPDFPGVRSTEDIDIFLKAEVISDPQKTQQIREALDRRGYETLTEYFQFQRNIDYRGSPRMVRVDFLSAPVSEALSTRVKTDSVRMRPQGFKGLHAHVTSEATTVEDSLMSIDIGKPSEDLTIYLPHPFSYLILKLHALRDRVADEEADYGRHHAFDIYGSMAMLTEAEWSESSRLAQKYEESTEVIEARRIVDEMFAGREAIGALRLREHARSAGYELPTEQLDLFMGSLQELLA